MTILGSIMMVWGVIDLFTNIFHNFAPQNISYCLLSGLGRVFDRNSTTKRWENVFLGIDTLAAFSIVATMVGFRLLPLAHPTLSRAWDAAVIANVLGVGLERIWRALR